MLFRSTFLAALGVVALAYTGVAAAQVPMVQVNNSLRPAYKDGEVIVKYRDGAIRSLNQMAALYQRLSVVSVKRYSGPFKNFEHLIFNTAHLSVEQAVADLQRDPSVEYVQPNYMLYATAAERAKPKTMGQPCMIPGLPFQIGRAHV